MARNRPSNRASALSRTSALTLFRGSALRPAARLGEACRDDEACSCSSSLSSCFAAASMDLAPPLLKNVSRYSPSVCLPPRATPAARASEKPDAVLALAPPCSLARNTEQVEGPVAFGASKSRGSKLARNKAVTASSTFLHCCRTVVAARCSPAAPAAEGGAPGSRPHAAGSSSVSHASAQQRSSTIVRHSCDAARRCVEEKEKVGSSLFPFSSTSRGPSFCWWSWTSRSCIVLRLLFEQDEEVSG
mmetsp:Transcript_27088/g.68332  ORF Transcript_27088/g.68332 Transcript_27088/m.68332 type:complete len:246 (+) Transcript_27088:5714-6451(+)